MEKFLKKFLNDNSICTGLCDLKRKTGSSNPGLKQNLYTEINSEIDTQIKQIAQQIVNEKLKKIRATKQIKNENKPLSKIFAEQQKQYLMQQRLQSQVQKNISSNNIQSYIQHNYNPNPNQENLKAI